MAILISRVQEIWGTTEWIEARPGLAVWDDALYLPATETGSHQVVPGHHGVHSPEPPASASVGTAPDGLYILVDVMTEHYGHFIADVLARLWPLAERAGEPVRIVCEPRHGRAFWERYGFMGEILAGLGLGLEAVVSFETAVRLPRVLVQEPGFHNLRCVHAVFGDLCRRAGRRYWSEAEVDTVARPAYLAKTRLTSGTQFFADEAEVVDELDRRGVDILFPEEMTFAEQVRLFATRRVVMGPVGSGFHTAAFSAPGRRIVGLSGMQHLNSNYLMFDAINRASAWYYVAHSTTHRPHPGFGFAWTIPEPRTVAAQLLLRAENLDRIDRYDRHEPPRPAGRLRRLVEGWSRLRSRPDRSP